MAARMVVKSMEEVWLFLKDSLLNLFENATQLWSISDWQVRVCFLLAAMLFLNVILIGIAWHVYGGTIAQMYRTKAKSKSSISLQKLSEESRKDSRKKTV